MNLADPILGESSQSQQDSVGCHSHEVPESSNSETEEGGGCQGLGRGRGSSCLMGTESVWEDEKLLETDGGDGCTTARCT